MASEAEQNWLDDYIEYGNAKRAVQQWFPDNKAPTTRAAQLKQKFSQEIENRVRAGFAQDAPQAASIIRHLARNAEQPAVKLKAAQDVLSRGGYNPVAESRELTEKPTEAELKERLRLALTGIDPATLKEILGTDTLQTIAKQISEEPAREQEMAELYSRY